MSDTDNLLGDSRLRVPAPVPLAALSNPHKIFVWVKGRLLRAHNRGAYIAMATASVY